MFPLRKLRFLLGFVLNDSPYSAKHRLAFTEDDGTQKDLEIADPVLLRQLGDNVAASQDHLSGAISLFIRRAFAARSPIASLEWLRDAVCRFLEKILNRMGSRPETRHRGPATVTKSPSSRPIRDRFFRGRPRPDDEPESVALPQRLPHDCHHSPRFLCCTLRLNGQIGCP
jgi:hypothetical protein